MADANPQVDLGLVLLQRAKNPEAIASAAGMFGESVDPRIRKAIAEKYAYLHAEPRRRDSGCFQRLALVRALRGRAAIDDVALLETALWTHEIIGRFDSASDLRAGALITLDEVEGRLASFHAARLLSDAHEMSGEPALTAARLLAAREEFLPLYQLVVNGEARAEVRAECLHGLTGLPASLMEKLLGQYLNEKDETILVGVFDLLLAHPSRASFADIVGSFLDRTQSTDLYRFMVSSVVATRDPALIAVLERADGPGEHSAKGQMLREALAVIRA